MLKKTFTSFIFFAILQVCIYSCCSDDYQVYYENVGLNAIDTFDEDSTSVASENLVLRVDLIYKYFLAAHIRPLKQFTNSAYATSCDEQYYFQDVVSDVIVTADVELFGIEAGNSINDMLLYINPMTLELDDFSNCVNFLNIEGGNRLDSFDILFNETLASGITITFNIEIKLESGRNLDDNTFEVTIE